MERLTPRISVVAWGIMGGGLALLHALDPATDVAGIAAGVVAVLFVDESRG